MCIPEGERLKQIAYYVLFYKKVITNLVLGKILYLSSSLSKQREKIVMLFSMCALSVVYNIFHM